MKSDIFYLFVGLWVVMWLQYNYLSKILGLGSSPALFTNVNYISNIIIAHTDLSKET